ELVAHGVAQAMQAQVRWQAGLVAPLPELLGEVVGLKRPAALGHQEGGESSDGRGVEDRPQFGVYQDGGLDAGLLAGNDDLVVADVLRPHAGELAAAGAGVARQREGEPSLASDRVVGLVLRELGGPPARPLLALGLGRLDSAGHVVTGMLEQAPQRLEVTTGGMRPEAFEPGGDEVLVEPPERGMAVALAEALKDPAAHALGAGSE